MEEQHASTSLTRPEAETLLKVTAFLHERLILFISSNIMLGEGGGFLDATLRGQADIDRLHKPHTAHMLGHNTSQARSSVCAPCFENGPTRKQTREEGKLWSCAHGGTALACLPSGPVRSLGRKLA